MFGSVHASAPAQLPASVPHPAAASHVAVQHWFDGPTAHAVGVAVHVHVLHVPVPLQ